MKGTELTPFDRDDPWLGKISLEGKKDPMYEKFKQYVRQKPDKLADTDPLKKFKGILPQISIFLVEET